MRLDGDWVYPSEREPENIPLWYWLALCFALGIITAHLDAIGML